MTSGKFKIFRQTLIENHFDITSDIFYAGYLWLSLTDKQIKILRNDVKAYANEYEETADGNIKIGMYILKP